MNYVPRNVMEEMLARRMADAEQVAREVNGGGWIASGESRRAELREIDHA